MPLDWVPLRLERVVEVAYTQLDGARMRYPAQSEDGVRTAIPQAAASIN